MRGPCPRFPLDIFATVLAYAGYVRGPCPATLAQELRVSPSSADAIATLSSNDFRHARRRRCVAAESVKCNCEKGGLGAVKEEIVPSPNARRAHQRTFSRVAVCMV